MGQMKPLLSWRIQKKKPKKQSKTKQPTLLISVGMEKVKCDDRGGWGKEEEALGVMLELILRGSSPWRSRRRALRRRNGRCRGPEAGLFTRWVSSRKKANQSKRRQKWGQVNWQKPDGVDLILL